MAGLTLQQAETQLALWLEADAKVAANQAWTYQGRTYTRADAEQIRLNIEFWDKQAKRLDRGGIRVRGVMPV
jgi:Family of unknown function (DUF6148)